MIIVVEPQCRGYEHEQFNAAFLYGYCLAYPSEKIIFFAEKEHITYVKNLLKSLGLILKQLDFKEISIPDKKLIQNPKAIIFYFKLFKNILKFADTNNCQKISFLSIYTFNLFPLKYLLVNKCRLNFILHIVMHGTLEFVKRKNYSFYSHTTNIIFNKIKKIFGFKINYSSNKIENKFIYEKYFKLCINILPLSNITYLLMRKDAEKSIRKYLPKNNLNFLGIDLPYISKNISLTSSINSNLQITFATFGKGYHNEILSLVDLLVKNRSLENLFKLQIIGGNEDYNLNKYTQVNYPIKKQNFTRTEIEVILSNVDYLLFFYESDSYELTTSGAFFDAIAYGKPIIFIKNICFDYYFDTFKFGYRYDNTEALIDDMPNIFRYHFQKYPTFLNEITIMQNKTSITNTYNNLIFDTN